MKKKLITILVIVLALVSIFAFTACDDKNDYPKDGRGERLTFEEGTTVEDVRKMIEYGEIKSVSIQESDAIILDENFQGFGECFYYDILEKKAARKIRNYWNYYFFENTFKYAMIYNPKLEEVVGVRKKELSGNELSENYFSKIVLEELLSFIDKADTIEIRNDRIIIRNETTENSSKEYIEIYDINCTKIELPEELKNYKEIAVDVE